jgi:hypothetical protein
LGLASCFVTPPIHFGGNGKSDRELQHDTLSTLMPAQLTAQGTAVALPTGELRVARVRVWADDEYRSQNLRWERGFDDQLDYVNQVLGPMLGVRLVADYASWPHHAPSGTLGDHLEALDRQDAGDDVAFVVGLTSSLSLAAATFEQIGLAELGGRHVMVRGHADLEERKAFERAFPDLGPEERAAVIEARRRHKTAAVLLHELAHNLGALHDLDADQVMSAGYSHHAASISEHNRALMQLELDDRLKPAAQRDPASVARRSLALLEAGSGWEASERDQRMTQLQAMAGSRPEVAAAAASPGPAAAGPDADWLAQAHQFQAAGALAKLEDALAHAGNARGAGELAAWAAMTRVRYGIPRDGARWKLKADDEADALVAVRGALELVNADQLDAAAKAAAKAEQRWPALPGLLAVRCDLELRRSAFGAARSLCERASAQDASSWALYLGGILELRGAGAAATTAGIARLRKAIAIDPELTQAWRALRKALERTNATAELDQLRSDYWARFHASL